MTAELSKFAVHSKLNINDHGSIEGFKGKSRCLEEVSLTTIIRKRK
jgi:hypothetical protein